MAKIKRLIKISLVGILALFLITICTLGILLGILHSKAARSLRWAKFERELFEVAGCYTCRPYPPDSGWTECSRVKEAWKYLQNETVKKIAFCDADYGDANLSPDNWGGWEIVEPEKIQKTLQMIRDANTGDNISIIWMGKMKIITDEHKFIIPIHWNNEAVYGYEWTSAELREQLRKWGLPFPR